LNVGVGSSCSSVVQTIFSFFHVLRTRPQLNTVSFDTHLTPETQPDASTGLEMQEMASGRRVRRVFEAVFISSDTRVGFGRHRQISTQPDASSPHLTPPQASTFMGWRRVRHVFGLFFLSSPMIFSGLPDTHHYPLAPSTFTMLLHTSDDIEHMVGLLYVILL
jgi:hypothetical protein